MEKTEIGSHGIMIRSHPPLYTDAIRLSRWSILSSLYSPWFSIDLNSSVHAPRGESDFRIGPNFFRKVHSNERSLFIKLLIHKVQIEGWLDGDLWGPLMLLGYEYDKIEVINSQGGEVYSWPN